MDLQHNGSVTGNWGGEEGSRILPLSPGDTHKSRIAQEEGKNGVPAHGAHNMLSGGRVPHECGWGSPFALEARVADLRQPQDSELHGGRITLSHTVRGTHEDSGATDPAQVKGTVLLQVTCSPSMLSWVLPKPAQRQGASIHKNRTGDESSPTQTRTLPASSLGFISCTTSRAHVGDAAPPCGCAQAKVCNTAAPAAVFEVFPTARRGRCLLSVRRM